MRLHKARRAAAAVALSLLGMLLPAGPAAADGPITVTLTASAAQVTYGGTVTFTIATSAGGAPGPERYIELHRTAADGTTTVVDVNVADAAGRAVMTDTATGRATYVARAESFSETGTDTGISNPVVVAVAVAVKPTASPTAVPPGGQLSVTATLRPAVPGGSVLVEERFGSEAWRTVATVSAAADGSVAVPLGARTKTGMYTFRVTRAADATWAAATAETTARVTVTGTGPAGAWRPIAGTKARPAHWQTCTIRYQVNPRGMPAQGMSDLREAFRRVTQVSGIKFRYVGRSRAVPHLGYGGPGTNRMVVAWAAPAATGGLLGPFTGGVGGTRRTSSGRILTGYVVMSTQFTKTAVPGFGTGAPHGMVLMHEIGHVVGLDHYNNRSQVMHPSAALPAAVWGAGDIAGLRQIGKVGGCR
jgi:5-hydroxyisourate hydrolase-like protein (transthyretin family)